MEIEGLMVKGVPDCSGGRAIVQQVVGRRRRRFGGGSGEDDSDLKSRTCSADDILPWEERL